MKRPTTVREFEAARSELKARLKAVRITSLRARAGASRDEEDQVRDELGTLERWLDEDTEMTSASGFVAGVILLSVGGTVAVVGGSVLGAAAYSKDSVVPVGAGLVVGGLVGGLVGIASLAFSSPRVMKTKAQASTPILPFPSPRLLVGPGTIGVGGTF